MKLLGLIMIAGAAALSGCGPSEEDLARAKIEAERDARMPQILEATRTYFGSRIKTAWGYWGVASVIPGEHLSFAPESNYVEVQIELPDDQALEIMSRSSPDQFRAVGWSACPKLSDPMWQRYGAKDQLSIQASYKGAIFIDVDCRRYAMP